MNTLKFAMLLTFAALAAPCQLQAQDATIAALSDAERAAILVPIDSYIKGHATGDGKLIAAAFHKDALLTGPGGGNVFSMKASSYAAGFSGKPEADEAQRKRSYELLSVSGDAAVVVVILDYPKVKFTDYMNLIRVNGKWAIAAKNFNRERR